MFGRRKYTIQCVCIFLWRFLSQHLSWTSWWSRWFRDNTWEGRTTSGLMYVTLFYNNFWQINGWANLLKFIIASTTSHGWMYHFVFSELDMLLRQPYFTGPTGPLVHWPLHNFRFSIFAVHFYWHHFISRHVSSPHRIFYAEKRKTETKGEWRPRYENDMKMMNGPVDQEDQEDQWNRAAACFYCCVSIIFYSCQFLIKL